jgi:tetratricopeptide (TPR) repeat protein/predicted aspartyl protease
MPASARPPLALLTLFAAVGLVMAVEAFSPQQDSPEIQLQLGNLLYADGRFSESLTAYEQAVGSPDPRVRMPARIGLVQSALRIGSFQKARSAAEVLREEQPSDAFAMAVYGDAMWSAGLFEEADRGYEAALALQPDVARGHNGAARILSARGQYEQALAHSRQAVSLDPREAEFHHTLGNVYERLGRYDHAATALASFVNLLPKGLADGRALWAGAELKFLTSFGTKTPYEFVSNPDVVYTMPFRLENEKIIIQGRVNGSRPIDFIVDTGAELSTISRTTSERQNVTPVTFTVSAGVGEVGLRGLQLGRIDKLEFGSLKVKQVPCIIKSPALEGLPAPEGESFSPLAMGLSVTVDYARRVMTLAKRLPDDGPADVTMNLWMNRLATVRGMVGDGQPRSFVVDTGGQVISISTDTARALPPKDLRKIALKVYGASGWDREAYLLPGVDLAFNDIRFSKMSVVVLNLRAPSVLLGYELGGIVGHRFLSRYRVAIDLSRSELRLTAS